MPEPPRAASDPLMAETIDATVPAPVDLSQLMASEPFTPVSSVTASAAVSHANQQALVRPQRAWFQGATLLYPYDGSRIYSVLTKDQSPTRLTFDPPERVIKVHFIEDDWFDIVLMEREEAQQPDTVVIIPKAPKLKKDIVILTTEHAYAIALESSATHGLMHVRWAHQRPVIVPKPLLPSGLYYANLDITLGAWVAALDPGRRLGYPCGGEDLSPIPPGDETLRDADYQGDWRGWRDERNDELARER